MALPKLTPEQRQDALDQAAVARQRRADVKVRLKASTATLTEVIHASRADDVIAKLRVVDLLQAMPGIGRIRAREIMQRLHIAESRRLRGLGANQVTALLAEFAERAEGPGRA